MGNASTKQNEYTLVGKINESQTNKISDEIIPEKLSVETTVKSINEHSKLSFKIECNPKLKGNMNDKRCFYLKRAHTNFINLYNKIKFNETYKFTYECNGEYAIIIDITEPEIHTISGIVNGFIDISTEFVFLNDKCEIIFSNNCTGRRIILPKETTKNIVVGKAYTFQYIKDYAANLYAAKTYNLSDNIS